MPLTGLRMAFPDVPQNLVAPPWPWMGISLNKPLSRLLWGVSPLLHAKPLGFVLSGPRPRIQWLQFDHLLFLSPVQFAVERSHTFPSEEGGTLHQSKEAIFDSWRFCDIGDSGVKAAVMVHRASPSTWKQRAPSPRLPAVSLVCSSTQG